MSEQFSYKDALGDLLKVDGVYGVLLIQANRVHTNLMPSFYSVNKIDTLAATAHEMASGFEGVMRTPEQFIFCYSGGILVCVFEPVILGKVNKKRHGIIFLVEDLKVVPFLCSAAVLFLRDYRDALKGSMPEAKGRVPLVNNSEWEQFQAAISKVVGKVMGFGVAQRFSDRVLASLGASAEMGLPKVRFREYAMAVILEIPNRHKQEVLRPEIDEILSQFEL